MQEPWREMGQLVAGNVNFQEPVVGEEGSQGSEERGKAPLLPISVNMEVYIFSFFPCTRAIECAREM